MDELKRRKIEVQGLQDEAELLAFEAIVRRIGDVIRRVMRRGAKLMDEAAHIRELALPSPAEDSDIQEALSLRYSDQVVILLRLRSGNFAVYNNMRELCGTTTDKELRGDEEGAATGGWPPSCWRPPPPPPIRRAAKQAIDLHELGLLE